MNPHKYILVHHFLNAFHYKLDTGVSDQAENLRKLLLILRQLQKNCALHDINIEDEVRMNLWTESSIPPSLTLVLRRLQKALEIDAAQLRFQEKKSAELLASLAKGKAVQKEFAEGEVQTAPVRELSGKVKVALEVYLDGATSNMEGGNSGAGYPGCNSCT